MLITLDVEASSLTDQSYPIQVGYTKVIDGKLVTSEFLIKPQADWTDWDEETEMYIHNINRDDLFLNGKDIYASCKELNEQLEGATVIVDSKDFDDFWINKLHDAANIERKYTLIHIDQYLNEKYGVYEGAFEDERENYTFGHQAGDDSHMIMQILRSLINTNPA